MIGNLYFLQEGPGGAIKIGWTTRDPHKRLKACQPYNSNDLRILGVLNSVFYCEKEWHQNWAHLRIRGEWFKASPDLLAAIDRAVAESERAQPQAEAVGIFPSEVRAWAARKGIRLTDMSKAMGYTPAYLTQHTALSATSMNWRLASRIEAFTKGAIAGAALVKGVPYLEARRQRPDVYAAKDRFTDAYLARKRAESAQPAARRETA